MKCYHCGFFNDYNVKNLFLCLLAICTSSLMTGLVVVQSTSHVQFFVIPWTAAPRLPCPLSSPGVCPSSWKTCLFKSFSIFYLGSLSSCCLVVLVLHIIRNQSIIRYMVSKYFSYHSVHYLFTFLLKNKINFNF